VSDSDTLIDMLDPLSSNIVLGNFVNKGICETATFAVSRCKVDALRVHISLCHMSVLGVRDRRRRPSWAC